MNLLGIVFNSDGEFYLFDGKPITVTGNFGHSVSALRGELVNRGIPVMMTEDFRYVCTAFDSKGKEWRVHKLVRTYPIDKFEGVTKHTTWPTPDKYMNEIIRTLQIKTA